MLGKRLNKIREHVEKWCREHEIYTSIVCDTIGIQGVKIYEKNQNTLCKLFEDLTPVLKADDIFLDVQKVRGGMILAFSVRALSESEIQQLLTQVGEIREPMTFTDRVSDAFVLPLDENHTPSELEFEKIASKIVEDQYKTANMGVTRSNQSSRQRNLHGVTMTHGGVIDGKRKHKKKTYCQPFESTIKRIFDSSESKVQRRFSQQLREALDGMATPDGAQPGDLFQKFARALAVLGQQMGIGPLQKQLKAQGINWKKSDDGQAIILYIMNAQTNAPQPIARIGAETLSKPNDFQTQLLNMIDFSKGEAPGAFKQQQDELRAQEKAARDIANSLNPQDQSIANQMAGNGGAPTSGGNAAAAAATQAASPKPQTGQVAQPQQAQAQARPQQAQPQQAQPQQAQTQARPQQSQQLSHRPMESRNHINLVLNQILEN